MSSAIHISAVRKILAEGKPVTLRVVSLRGRVIDMPDAVSLSFDFYAGTRTVKLLRSGEKRTIHDCLIVALDGMEVFF